jgi:hypothetical protein
VKTHNEIFDKLQQDYIHERDIEQNQASASIVLGKMYELILEMTGNYIKKYQLSHGIRLDTKTLSHDAALYIIEQYLRKPKFRIKRLSAYAYFGCLKALFADSKREQIEVSYEQYREHKQENT